MNFASSRLVQNSNVTTRSIDGEMVIFSVRQEAIIRLNGTARAVWELLREPQTPAGIIETLCERYEGDVGTMRADLAVFLGQLVDRHLVKVLDA